MTSIHAHLNLQTPYPELNEWENNFFLIKSILQSNFLTMQHCFIIFHYFVQTCNKVWNHCTFFLNIAVQHLQFGLHQMPLPCGVQLFSLHCKMCCGIGFQTTRSKGKMIVSFFLAALCNGHCNHQVHNGVHLCVEGKFLVVLHLLQ